MENTKKRVRIKDDSCLYSMNTIHVHRRHNFTHENIAPEIIQGEKYGKSSDWWALGVPIFK